jgi:hypothetical protein
LAIEMAPDDDDKSRPGDLATSRLVSICVLTICPIVVMRVGQDVAQFAQQSVGDRRAAAHDLDRATCAGIPRTS